MLTREKLVELYRGHRDEHVLSIYLDAEEHDPAKRRAWRRAFDHVMERVQRTVDGADREDFENALVHIRTELRRYDAFLPGSGWVGFANAHGLLYAENMPVPMPNLGCWEEGPHVAPYVRALKQARPILSVLVDARHARLYRYRDGRLAPVEELLAEKIIDDLTDVNTSKRAATHTGMRGETATDVAQRLQEHHTEQMLRHLAERIGDEVGVDGYVVLGGTRETIHAALGHLHKSLLPRVYEAPALHFDMSDADVRRVTEEAASELSRKRQEAMVGEVVDTAHAGGRACLGREATDAALLDRRVELLVLSREMAQREPEYADECVGRAFDQGAEVEELSASAGARLDAEGDGIGARVRFVP